MNRETSPSFGLASALESHEGSPEEVNLFLLWPLLRCLALSRNMARILLIRLGQSRTLVLVFWELFMLSCSLIWYQSLFDINVELSVDVQLHKL